MRIAEFNNLLEKAYEAARPHEGGYVQCQGHCCGHSNCGCDCGVWVKEYEFSPDELAEFVSTVLLLGSEQ